MQKYHIFSRIGAGGQGSVFKAQAIEGKILVAIKKIQCQTLNELNLALCEAQVTLQLRHPHIVRCHEFFVSREIDLQCFPKQFISSSSSSDGPHETQKKKSNHAPKSANHILEYPTTSQSKHPNLDDVNHEYVQQIFSHISLNNNSFHDFERWFVCIIFEYCEKGSLKTIIEKQKSISSSSVTSNQDDHDTDNNPNNTSVLLITEEKFWNWMRQICEGINHMHQFQLIHRDLKAENIFLTSNGDIKIGDMGLAKKLDKTFANSILGTTGFISPELRSNSPLYNEKIDIWGIGCIAMELASLKRCDYAYEMAVNPNGLLSIASKNYSNKVIDFIKVTLSQNPNERPSAYQLLQHFFGYTPSSAVSVIYSSEELMPLQSQKHLIEEENEPLSFTTQHSSGSVSSKSPSSSLRHSFGKKVKLLQNLMENFYADLFIIIFTFLQPKDLGRCMLVSTTWKDVIEKNKYVWEQLFKSEFGWSISLEEENRILQEFGNMKRAFSYRSGIEYNWCKGSSNYYNFKTFKINPSSGIHGLKLLSGDKINTHYLGHYEGLKQSTTYTTTSSLSPSASPTLGSNNPLLNTTCNSSNEGMKAMLVTSDTEGNILLHKLSGLGFPRPQGKNTKNKLQLETLKSFDAHVGLVWAMDINLKKVERICVTGGFDGNVVLWDILSGSILHKFDRIHNSEVWDLCILNSSSIATAAQDSSMKVCDITSRKVIRSYDKAHHTALYAIHCDSYEIHPTCLATGSLEGLVKIWDIRIPEKEAATVESYCVYSSSYSKPTGNSVYELNWLGSTLIAGRGKGDIDVYDIRNLSQPVVQHLTPTTTPLSHYPASNYTDTNNTHRFNMNLKNNGAIRGLCSDYRKIISGGSRAAITISSIQDGRFINTLTDLQQIGPPSGKPYYVNNIEVNNEATLVAGCSEGTVAVFDFSCVSPAFGGSLNYLDLNERGKKTNCTVQ